MYLTFPNVYITKLRVNLAVYFDVISCFVAVNLQKWSHNSALNLYLTLFLNYMHYLTTPNVSIVRLRVSLAILFRRTLVFRGAKYAKPSHYSTLNSYLTLFLNLF